MSDATVTDAGQVRPRLLPGDPVPWFRCATATNPRYNFAAAAGRYLLLVFPGPTTYPGAEAAHGRLRAAQAEGLLNDLRVACFVVSIDPADDAPGGRATRCRACASSTTATARSAASTGSRCRSQGRPTATPRPRS
jgi:hypothetical protein